MSSLTALGSVLVSGMHWLISASNYKVVRWRFSLGIRARKKHLTAIVTSPRTGIIGRHRRWWQTAFKNKTSGIAKYRRDFGVVFQDHQLLSDRSVYHNVALPLEIAGFTQRDIDRRVRAALDKVGLLDRERANPDTLSGGEQQRVGIARAVVARPKILIADEPTGNLDPQLSAEIMGLFSAFNSVGVTVVVASHDLALISRMSHRILTLDKGSLITVGDSQRGRD